MLPLGAVLLQIQECTPTGANDSALGLQVLVKIPLLASERLCLDCRIQLAEKFVKAVSKPSRPDMNPIR